MPRRNWRLGAQELIKCRGCEVEFEPTHPSQKYHDSKCRGRTTQASYRATEKGRRNQSSRDKAYLSTENGKQTRVNRNRKYRATENGQKKSKESNRRWLKTPLGLVYLARHAKRYNKDGIGAFFLFKKLSFRDQTSCAKCGTPWVDGPRGVGHEIDHIKARGLGGSHDPANLQVLCVDCHKAKTIMDMRAIRKRKQSQA